MVSFTYKVCSVINFELKASALGAQINHQYVRELVSKTKSRSLHFILLSQPTRLLKEEKRHQNEELNHTADQAQKHDLTRHLNNWESG